MGVSFVRESALAWGCYNVEKTGCFRGRADEGGWGLLLVSMLSSQQGVIEGRGKGGEGKGN